MGVFSNYPQVYLRHDGIDGEALVSGEPGVVEMYESLGWRRYALPTHLDPDAPDAGVTNLPVEKPEPILSPEEVEDLKGKALDEALEDAGLSKSGTADEKRARLAEYEAGLANPTTTEGDEVNG